MVLPDVPEILAGMLKRNLSTIQSGLDNVRNPTGSPLAGIDPAEIVDTRPYVAAINEYTVNAGRGNPEIANLPRKWNVTARSLLSAEGACAAPAPPAA